jgi:PTH1 family peptidyl-tRNA hydrolase
LFLLCGLGNKGSEYAGTRHNAGYLVIERFSRVLNIPFSKKISGCRIGVSESLILAKPVTYMNLSGGPVFSLLKKMNIGLENFLLIHDDLDMELGRIRIRLGGSDGGHKGVRSVMETLGSSQFYRLKLGIGRDPAMPPEDYVLSRFRDHEMKTLEETLETAVEAAKTFVFDGKAKAMSMYNRR